MPPPTYKTWVFTAPHSARLDELLVALGSTNEIAAVDYQLLGKKIAQVITQAGTHPRSKRSSQRRALNRQRDRA
jgi:hypothetical protein